MAPHFYTWYLARVVADLSAKNGLRVPGRVFHDNADCPAALGTVPFPAI